MKATIHNIRTGKDEVITGLPADLHDYLPQDEKYQKAFDEMVADGTDPRLAASRVCDMAIEEMVLGMVSRAFGGAVIVEVEHGDPKQRKAHLN